MRQDQHELIATKPRDRVRLAHRATQALGDRLEQLVSRIVAEGIVDAFEVIEVEK